jgi:hypothetical protein
MAAQRTFPIFERGLGFRHPSEPEQAFDPIQMD